jgi:hypothetical protein
MAGGAGVLVLVAIVIARRSLSSPAPDRAAEPIARVVPPAAIVPPRETQGEPSGDPTGSPGLAEITQMNPPEAGLFDPPETAAPKIEKIPDAGADTTTVSTPPSTVKPAPPGKAPQLKPAPVDSKDSPLGPLISPSILVEKSALRLTVFDGDSGVKSYRVAAGAVMGDKQCEGDRKTPEGDFYICIRKTKGQTRYTRSLGLSYPNLEDAQRGRRDGLITAAQYYSIAQAIKNNRKPPWQTKLGGAIMIHGKRENRTGTLGCVALDDDDIIELYNRLPLNTPVRIIP